MSPEFLLTSLIIVASPGTGAIYTIAAGLTRGSRASVLAAFACTIGIVPHLIAAMMGIAAEAKAIEEGSLDAENNPLKRAPHTVEDLVGEWDRPYSREAACYPAGAFRVDKYWSPVNRVDNVYGDRHLICSCPPMESYIEAAE